MPVSRSMLRRVNAWHLILRFASIAALLLFGCDGEAPEAAAPPPPLPPPAAQQPEPAPLPTGVEPPASIDERTAPPAEPSARAPKAPPARREREAPVNRDEAATAAPRAPTAAATPGPNTPAEAAKAPPEPPPAPAPAPAAPSNKVVVPSTEHVRIDIPRGLQALLDADPRMQPWLTKVIGVIDRCYTSERGRAPDAAGAIQIAITMHVNARPDADVKSVPAQLGGVVACATPELMRARPPLFTGPEGERHTVNVRFSR